MGFLGFQCLFKNRKNHKNRMLCPKTPQNTSLQVVLKLCYVSHAPTTAPNQGMRPPKSKDSCKKTKIDIAGQANISSRIISNGDASYSNNSRHCNVQHALRARARARASGQVENKSFCGKEKPFQNSFGDDVFGSLGCYACVDHLTNTFQFTGKDKWIYDPPRAPAEPPKPEDETS